MTKRLNKIRANFATIDWQYKWYTRREIQGMLNSRNQRQYEDEPIFFSQMLPFTTFITLKVQTLKPVRHRPQQTSDPNFCFVFLVC